VAQHVSGASTPTIRSSKTVVPASGFTFGCRPCNDRQPKSYVKPEAAITVFELLIMGGVSPETCLAIKKHWNNKFYHTVASCWFLLWDLCKWYVCSCEILCIVRFGTALEDGEDRLSRKVVNHQSTLRDFPADQRFLVRWFYMK